MKLRWNAHSIFHCKQFGRKITAERQGEFDEIKKMTMYFSTLNGIQWIKGHFQTKTDFSDDFLQSRSLFQGRGRLCPPIGFPCLK